MHSFINTHRIALLSLCSGLMLWLSWPAQGFPFFVFAGLVPLFFIEDHIFRNRHQYHKFSVLLAAWLAFMIFNLLTTWWILYASVAGMIVAVLLNSLFMAIPWALMHSARRILPGNHGPLSVIVFWLAFEHLHSLWELSWSWLDLGNVFATVPEWIQWYEYTGVAGGTLWILVVNILIFLLAKQLFYPRPQIRKLFWHGLFLVFAVGGPLIISAVIGNNFNENQETTEVLIIQPGEDPYERAETREEIIERIDHMLDLARENITPHTRFVVAPEGASPLGIWAGDEESHLMVVAIREFQDEFPHAVWVFGSFTYQMYYSSNQAPPTARRYRDTSRYYEAFNSAVMVPYYKPVEFYHKSKLVPGIERMPFFHLLGPLGTLVETFGGTAGSLGTQEYRTAFSVEGYPDVAPVICYESIYGHYMQGYMQAGASLILIITNDGWWRNTPGYRQHNQYARLRAIEARRSIARSASTGISSFIDQKGNIIKSTGWWEADAITANLALNQNMTFFTMNGNFIGKLSVFVSVLLIFFIFSQGIIKRDRQKKPGAKG